MHQLFSFSSGLKERAMAVHDGTEFRKKSFSCELSPTYPNNTVPEKSRSLRVLHMLTSIVGLLHAYTYTNANKHTYTHMLCFCLPLPLPPPFTFSVFMSSIFEWVAELFGRKRTSIEVCRDS